MMEAAAGTNPVNREETVFVELCEGLNVENHRLTLALDNLNDVEQRVFGPRPTAVDEPEGLGGPSGSVASLRWELERLRNLNQRLAETAESLARL